MSIVSRPKTGAANVKLSTFIQHQYFKPILGAALVVMSGLALLLMPLGEPWVLASYDYIFRFGARSLTNQVVLVAMDNEAHDSLGQSRGKWDRQLHARLLQVLANDGAAVAVLDVFFEKPGDPSVDAALAAALRRQKQVVLMAKQADLAHPAIDSARPMFPAELFLTAAQGNWGVAWLDPSLDGIVRCHWPFGVTEIYDDLPTVVARLTGVTSKARPEERWLRYYSEEGAWTSLSYHLALAQPAHYFSNKIVFIGNRPETPLPDGEMDEFRTPYTRWTGRSVGGAEILLTSFLNLANQDWLRRSHRWLEMLLLVVTGIGLAFALHRPWHPITALGLAAAMSLGAVLAGVSLSHLTNHWFPYLIIAGGQIPCALVWSLTMRHLPVATVVVPPGTAPAQPVADVPDYELFEPPFGEGAYGKVWLARNAVGQWQAFKAVYLAKFNHNPDPYDREFNGIRRYKPISDKHPGLLRVDFVSHKKREGYFYYVMELGDSLVPGWEENPALYKPRDLAGVRAQAPGKRLSIAECTAIGVTLAEALDFLHRLKLTHRDIKPSNIFFVNGRPKLGDVGLVTDLKTSGGDNTWVGTQGYMPPPPERPGTMQADVFGLGMVLYVISTGREPEAFPEISATIVGRMESAAFLPWNKIIVKACHPDTVQRYASAAELHADLLLLQAALAGSRPAVPPAV